MECPECKNDIPEDSQFCNKCGCHLTKGTDRSEGTCVMDSERKLVTVMFSDMSGYTIMTERLDPEEVKEIMSQIFGKITEIIKNYDGFIERFIGDAVMAVFGVPKVHEDDPIRAIRAARDIHSAVEAFSPQFEKKIGRSLTMHTGINTGLVVTGEVDVEKGTHGLTGDAINLASRLEGLAKSNEIIVGESTYQLTKRHFNFEAIEPTQVKGKKEPVPTYKMLSLLDQQAITKTLKGVQSKLVGRETEMNQLIEAVENLKQGKGSIVSIVGDAGTGKSRLTREFRANIAASKVQWREGHAYPYTQNMAYYPLTNLLTYAFQIRENDKPDLIKDKVENGVQELLWDKPKAKNYIGGLFSIIYEDIDEMSPEFWQKQLHLSVQQLLEALAGRGPTVILFEDLHWADASFIDLLYLLLENTRHPVLFVCVYRPSFNLYPGGKPNSVACPYHEIILLDLSWDHTQSMLQSLLGSHLLPEKLSYFIKQKAEGNPFYLEEVVNSLIESGILVSDNENWKLTRALDLNDIPPTIQGVLIARLDRLEKETKRILQEASVIGRAFFYQVLNRVTELSSGVDESLLGLESLDLIRSRTRDQDLEYIFKHALTQEVVYNGLLKKERKQIHERIAIVMEQLFIDRLPEFYETLAFHFSRGLSLNKAINYLMKAGKKCLARYSIEESHQYYKQAYEILDGKSDKSNTENELLIDLIIEWTYVLYYRGYFKEMSEILFANKRIAETLEDKTKLGIYYSWYGFSLFNQNMVSESYPWLEKALQIGEESEDQLVIGYACTWLTWYYAAIGKFDRAIKHGERTLDISNTYKSDAYLYFKSLGGLGFAYCGKGDMLKTLEIGNTLIDYGNKHSNIRSLTIGHGVVAAAYNYDNDLSTAIGIYEKAIEVGVEPYYVEFIRMNLILAYITNDQFHEAENAIDCVVNFSQKTGAWIAGAPAHAFSGAVLISKGKMSDGLKRLEEGKQELFKNGSVFYSLVCEYIIAKIFSRLAERSEPITLSLMVKNIGFLVKNAPFAGQKAEALFQHVIAVSKEMGSKPIMGSACLDLGLLYMNMKKKNRANKYISKAYKLFEESGSVVYLKQASEALKSLQ